MNILDNELVLKYFGCDRNCDKYGKSHPDSCEGWIAKQVLLAMQEPIKKGERYLIWISEMPGSYAAHPEAHFDERICDEQKAQTGLGNCEDNFDAYHPQALRLPSRFQETAKKGCPDHPNAIACCHDPKCPHPTHALESKPNGEVEEKIAELLHKLRYADPWLASAKQVEELQSELRELVALARKGE